MQRTAMMAVLSAALVTGANTSFANETMSEMQCIEVIIAVSKLEMATAGMAPLDEALADVKAIQPTIPADVGPPVDNLISIAKSAQEIEIGDPTHPMATGDSQEASLSYQKALAPYCPDYNLED